jgi:uncharacterized protein YyaL (SSP411 family)
VNRLARESSPYLRQHQHNPVDWYPWGPEALERSQREQKPIFLSIGYSACHWCHVMEHESFSDPEIARWMNENFVNIKVDREERPDLDEIYMTAVQRMTGHGGWPMSVFLTPDRKPFFGGTYFPPVDRHGMPGFARVLRHLSGLWQDRRADVLRAGDDMAADLAKVLAPPLAPGMPEAGAIAAAAAASRDRFDPEHGGFGWPPRFAPKFPHAVELTLLLRHAGRTGDRQLLDVACRTLTAMARGGIYDQVGGGFHRYSVDREWLVPHFEKMLYDNALLARVYAEAWVATQDPLYRRIATETLDYLLAEMRDPAGGFWSATDADSEGVEGKYFVWTLAELESALGARAALAASHFGVTAGGNFEGHNVLTLARTVDELAADTRRDAAEIEAELGQARRTLYAQRRQRVPPATDDKVLAAWNGLTLAAFAAGHQAFGEPRYLAAAQRLAAFLCERMIVDGRLRRSWRGGEARLAGYLEDHAFVADGLLALFESDFDPRWLAAGLDLLRQTAARFGAPDGGLWFTADDHEALVARSRSATESSTPSGAGVAALALLRAGRLAGDEALYDRGLAVLAANGEVVAKLPAACPSLLLALDFDRADPREIVIAAEPTEPEHAAFLQVVRRLHPPRHVVAVRSVASAARLDELAPALRGKDRIDGRPAAYVCRRGLCSAPVTSPAALKLD